MSFPQLPGLDFGGIEGLDLAPGSQLGITGIPDLGTATQAEIDAALIGNFTNPSFLQFLQTEGVLDPNLRIFLPPPGEPPLEVLPPVLPAEPPLLLDPTPEVPAPTFPPVIGLPQTLEQPMEFFTVPAPPPEPLTALEQLEAEIEAASGGIITATPPPPPPRPTFPTINLPEEGPSIFQAIAGLLNRLISALPAILGRAPSINFPTLPGSRGDPFGIPFPTAPQIAGLPATQPQPAPPTQPPTVPEAVSTNVNTVLCLLAARLAQRNCDDAADRLRAEFAALLAALGGQVPFSQEQVAVGRTAGGTGFPGFDVGGLLGQAASIFGQVAPGIASLLGGAGAVPRALPPGSGTPTPIQQASLLPAIIPAASGLAGTIARALPAVATGVGIEQLLDLVPGGAGRGGDPSMKGLFTPKGNPRKIGMLNGRWFAHAGTPKTWTKVSFKHPHAHHRRHHHHP